MVNLYRIEESADYVEEKAAFVATHGAGTTLKTADLPCEPAAGGARVASAYKMKGVKLAHLNPFLHEGDVDMPSAPPTTPCAHE